MLDTQPSASDRTILVAEDNPTNQILVRALLRSGGYEVAVVRNGREAVEAYEQRAYGLILMDCHMPEMDGLEATRRIRQRERRLNMNGVPIIALTGNHGTDVRAACLEAGMDDFLSKPYDTRQISEVVSRWLQV
jgi:CheY-like chemotaxis protein